MDTENIESSVEATAAVGTGESGAAPEGQATPPAAADGGTAESESVALKQARKDIARTAKALANLQAENARLKTDAKPEARSVETAKAKPESTPAPYDGDIDKHSALKGLPEDDNGDVLYKGTYLPKEFVVAQYDEAQARAAELEDLKSWRKELETSRATEAQTREEADYQAKVQAAERELTDTVVKAVTGMRAEAFPKLGDERAGKIDKALLRAVDDMLSRALTDGEELSADLIERIAKDALAETKELFGVFGESTVRDNLNYKNQHPVKPGGTPGTVAPARPTSRAEKDKLDRDAAARLTASLQ